VQCKHDLCELFDHVINYTNEIIKTNDPGVDDLVKEFPNLLKKLRHEREKVEKEIVPILVLGMFSQYMILANTYLFNCFFFLYIFKYIFHG